MILGTLIIVSLIWNIVSLVILYKLYLKFDVANREIKTEVKEAKPVEEIQENVYMQKIFDEWLNGAKRGD